MGLPVSLAGDSGWRCLSSGPTHRRGNLGVFRVIPKEWIVVMCGIAKRENWSTGRMRRAARRIGWDRKIPSCFRNTKTYGGMYGGRSK